MDRVTNHLRFAKRTGLCPVCRKRKRAEWKDGSGLRITCGNADCYIKWLPGKHTPIDAHVEELSKPEE